MPMHNLLVQNKLYTSKFQHMPLSVLVRIANENKNAIPVPLLERPQRNSQVTVTMFVEAVLKFL